MDCSKTFICKLLKDVSCARLTLLFLFIPIFSLFCFSVLRFTYISFLSSSFLPRYPSFFLCIFFSFLSVFSCFSVFLHSLLTLILFSLPVFLPFSWPRRATRHPHTHPASLIHVPHHMYLSLYRHSFITHSPSSLRPHQHRYTHSISHWRHVKVEMPKGELLDLKEKLKDCIAIILYIVTRYMLHQ